MKRFTNGDDLFRKAVWVYEAYALKSQYESFVEKVKNMDGVTVDFNETDYYNPEYGEDYVFVSVKVVGTEAGLASEGMSIINEEIMF